MLSASVFDNTAKVYDVSKILTPDYKFDPAAYQGYSKVYLPITYALSYAAQFASLTALITHTACWHGKDMWEQTLRSFRSDGSSSKPGYQPVTDGRSRKPSLGNRTHRNGLLNEEAGVAAPMDGQDVHNRLMTRYEDAPITWYLATLLSMLGVGIFLVEYFPVHLPWYGLLFALGITTLLFVPVGIVMAITNQHSSLYLVSQLIAGAVFPGRPIASMVSHDTSLLSLLFQDI